MVVSISERAASVESFKVMDIFRRANELQALGHPVLHCEVGQPESGAPNHVAQAAIRALSVISNIDNNDHGNSNRNTLGYTDSFGLLELRKKISAHYTKQYRTSTDSIDSSNSKHTGTSSTDALILPTNRIIVTTGSSGAFLLAFTACFDVGDVVAIASSGYPCYRNILQALGCTICNIPINNEFKLTDTELRTEIQRRQREQLTPIKGLILSSPSNPTGAMLTPHELSALCRLTDECNIQFISDEIYHGITYNTKAATALQYSENAIVINSFSKYYSMSGWRLGWMIIPNQLIEPINSLQQNMFISAPTISQTAAIKCWDDETIAELEQHVTKYKTSRSIILTELASLPQIDRRNIAPADGGFYIYVDLGDENVTEQFGSTTMCQLLLEEQFVAFTPGVDFEDPTTILGERRFRISYSQGIDVVTEAMKRFQIFFPTWIERVENEKAKKGKMSS